MLRLGRADDSDIRFSDAADDSVSGVHAELTLEGNRLYVEDKRSSNGTFVNGAACPPFQKVVVPDGSRIQLARQGPEMQVVAEAAKPADRGAATAAAAAGATVVPAKESVGKNTLIQEIARAGQESRDHVDSQLDATRRRGTVILAAAILGVLVLGAAAFGLYTWWSHKESQNARRGGSRAAAPRHRGRHQRLVGGRTKGQPGGGLHRVRLSHPRDQRNRVDLHPGDRLRRPDPPRPHPHRPPRGRAVAILPARQAHVHRRRLWRPLQLGLGRVREGARGQGRIDLLQVRFPKQRPLKATLVSGEGERSEDLALLQVQQTMAPSVGLGPGNQNVKVTDEIAIMGYPGELGQYAIAVSNSTGVGNPIARITEAVPTFIKGTVAQPLTGTGTSSHLLFFDASIAPGNSGGPVVNRQGELVGIVSLQFNRPGAPIKAFGSNYSTCIPMEAGNAAVSPDDIQSFLRKHGII